MNTKFLFVIIPILISLNLSAQNKIELVVKDSASNEYLVGVGVLLDGTSIGTITNNRGVAVLSNIPSGSQRLTVSLVGYKKTSISLPNTAQPLVVLLVPESEEMDEVIVTATRNNSRIEDLPTKIEVMGLDDMEEENTIRPANITSLLGDIAGIQMQQTSASSGNTNARIQGLNGRYSQILKDGMPLFGGFSGSFSILQIPPIDLRQIEIIKGSASTLFGGDAIGGIINLVSKKPSFKPETNILINQTSLKETDINTYISRKYEKFGFTLFAGHVFQKPVDVNKDGFSDAPDVRNFVIHPKMFWYFDNTTTLSIGINSTVENRKGGDMEVIQHSVSTQHQYFVKHNSFRNTGDLNFEKKMDDGSQLQFKGSTSVLDRGIETPQYKFNANQTLYYSELSYFLKKDKFDFVFGANLNGDNFQKQHTDTLNVANYSNSTIGLFVQNDWHVTDKFLIESGMRYDYHSARGRFILPRLSLMYKFMPEFSARLNGGLGYKVPSLFSYIDEETDLNRLATNPSGLKTERSQGVNFDVNYNTIVAQSLSVTVNQSFFYTLLSDPIVYSLNSNNQVQLFNASKAVETKGSQTYIRLSYSEFELYVSYVYTHAIKKYDNSNPWFLATPEHNLSTTLTFAPNNKWRIGFENMLVGQQRIENNTQTPAYDFMAAMVERKFKKVSIVLNCENLFDYRQTDYLIPPTTNPSFKTLWAPIDGRVVNLSINFRL